jgi:hypothetical protein
MIQEWHDFKNRRKIIFHATARFACDGSFIFCGGRFGGNRDTGYAVPEENAESRQKQWTNRNGKTRRLYTYIVRTIDRFETTLTTV